MPFWFLNGYMTEQHVVREFGMMKDKGISEVIVHPRYGLQCEYLSDEWFELFGWCVREAKKHGMYVWIYDELNWPSGTAGMSVMNIDPSYRGKYLAVESKPLTEIDLDSFEPGDYAIVARFEDGAIAETRLIEDKAAIASLAGDWRVFNCTRRDDRFYVDTLSFDAINCFKRLTYDEYYKRFGDEFGKTIRAIFTDEPSIYWVSVGYDDWNLPYTDDYFQTFEARFGYDPAPMIPYLFHQCEQGEAFRADYWDHAGYLFNERYHGNLGGWCRDHGIIYTGHNNHEEPLRYQIRFQGDAFGTMRRLDIPGVDHLQKATLGNNWISIIGHKICSSQAHISGKARCMSESFGVMEWDTTFTNLKRVTDWQYALGINLLIPHAIYHTIAGFTKRESPPSFFYQSPHWDDFDYFGDYVKRLEEMLCGGRHLCKVAVMYPKSGLWSSYQSDGKTPDFESIDASINALCLDLVKNQIDFDLVDAEALAEAKLADGKIKLADEAFEVLIVPESPYMRPEEIARLSEIAGAGVRTVRADGLDVGTLKKELDHDIQITGGGADEIMAYRREKDGRKITFLLNRSEKHRKVVAMVKDYADGAIFDQETGTYTKLEGKKLGNKVQVQLRFQPNQSYFVVSNVADAQAPRQAQGEPTPIALKDLRVETGANVASLYHFSYTPPSEHDGAPSPGGEGWGEGASDPPETIEVDVRTNPIYIPCNWDPNVPDFKQYAGVYETSVQIDFDIENHLDPQEPEETCLLIVDKDFADCKVFVNGTQVELDTVPESMVLTDLQDVWAPIGELLRQGENIFTVISPTKLSEPLRLVGSFRVKLDDKKVALLAPADSDPFALEADYPFYSGKITYLAEFDLASRPASLLLDLHDVRDSATIYLNGRLVGKRLWAPYTLDIARRAKQGENTVVIEVRNNMANLIYGTPRAMGLRSAPSLARFGE